MTIRTCRWLTGMTRLVCLLAVSLGSGAGAQAQELAYYWTGDTSIHSFNPAGVTTLTHTATGVYSVNFAGNQFVAGNGGDGNIQNTAYGGSEYCKVEEWSSAYVVTVLCFNTAGVPADSLFTITLLQIANKQNIAYAWVDDKTSSTSTPLAAAALNPGGGVTVTHSSPGNYAVTFAGLNGNGGTVQVTAFGADNVSCNIINWGLDTAYFTANVGCTDPLGVKADSQFDIAVIPAGVVMAGAAFAYAKEDSTSSYTAEAGFSYAPGYLPTLTHTSQGNFTVTFPGLNPSSRNGGNVLATSKSSPGRCSANSWVSQGSTSIVANVLCFDTSGNPADAEFTILSLAPQSLTTNASTVNFSYQAGGAQPAGQSVALSALPADVTLTVDPPSVRWVTATLSAASMPANLNISVNPAGRPSGLSSVTLTVHGSGGVADVSVKVNLNITLNLPPTPVSATPAAGSATQQSFAFAFSDPNGYADFQVVDVVINNVLDGRHACYAAFTPSGAGSGSLYLVDDGGDAGGPYPGMLLPGSGTVSNSQCSISGSGSGVSSSGNTPTLTLAITFTGSFSGNKVFYMSAEDKAMNNSGWQALGTWNVPGSTPAGPSVSGMSPGRNTSSTQSYTFTFSDTNGFQDITIANVLINTAIDGRHACYLAFAPATGTAGTLYLVDDAGDAAGPYQSLTLPGSGSVSNSQCTITAVGGSVLGSGNTLTLILSITLNHSFTGNQIFFAAAGNNTVNSGWQSVGSVGVP